MHEQNCPIAHIEKFSLIKGDASMRQEVGRDNHALVAMAILIWTFKVTRMLWKRLSQNLQREVCSSLMN